MQFVGPLRRGIFIRVHPLFEQIKRPQFQLESPSRILSEAEFDLLRITVEDFRFVTREITRDLNDLAADIRSRSTILRRLLCHSEATPINAGGMEGFFIRAQ
jgi:hypothetical protein